MGSALGKYAVDCNRSSPKALVFDESVSSVCFQLLSRVLK